MEMTGASDSETADILAGHWWGTQHFCGFDERMGACPLSAEHACLFSSCFGPSREHNALNMITIRCQQSGPVALLWFANLSRHDEVVPPRARLQQRTLEASDCAEWWCQVVQVPSFRKDAASPT